MGLGIPVTTLLVDTVQAAPVPNYALQFDGADDYVRAPDVGNFDFSTSFTIELWARPETISPSVLFRGLLSGRNGTTPNSVGGWVLYQDKDDPSRWGTSVCTPGCVAPKAAAGSLTFGEWHHLAAVYDGAEVRIYQDGELADSALQSGDVTDSTYLFVGAWTGSFLGTVDEIRVWNIARTQQQIVSTMVTPLQGDEPGLVAYWPMDDGAGQFALDATANGQDARLGSSDSPDAQDPVWIVSDSPRIEPAFQLIPVVAGLGTDIGITSIFGGVFNCGWSPGETVQVWWDKPEAQLAQFTVDPQGCFQGMFNLDDGERIPGSEAGTHQVQARGSVTGVLTSPFEQVVPQLQLNPTSGFSEREVSVSGCGWDGESQVDVVWQRTFDVLGRFDVDPGTGCIDDVLTIPRTKDGLYDLAAYGLSGMTISGAAYWVMLPTIFLTPPEGPPGAHVPLAGCNWAPEEQIEFAFSDDLVVFDTWGTSIGGCITSGGPTQPTLAIPESATLGLKAVVATGLDSGQVVQVPFEVIERSLLFDPAQGLPGDSVLASGCGWVGNAQVTLEWGYPDTNGFPIQWLASVDPDNGCFGLVGDVEIEVPLNTITGPVDVTATGDTDGITMSTFTVIHPGYIEFPDPNGYAGSTLGVDVFDAVVGETLTFKWDDGIPFDGFGAAVPDFSQDITLPDYISVGAHDVTVAGSKGFKDSATVNILDNAQIAVTTMGDIHAGDSIDVAGTDWAADEVVSFHLEMGLDSWPIADTTVVPGGQLDFSASITLPEGLADGLYTLVAQGDKGRDAETSLSILGNPLPAFSLTAEYPSSPPRLDGTLAGGEWDYGQRFNFSNGFITVRSDDTRLYVLLDMLGDNSSDAPGQDNFWLSFDVLQNQQIDAGLDLNFRLDGSGDLILEEYSGPNSFSPRNSTYLRSAYGTGFNCSFLDGTLGLTLVGFIPVVSCDAHRVWEIAIDLQTINAVPGSTVRMGIRMISPSPVIDQMLPSGFSSDFSALGVVNLAPSMLDPNPPAGAVTGIGSNGFEVEVTQAIQDADNSLPLVADKDTVVRVYPQVQDEALVRLHLFGQRNGLDLPGSPLVALAVVPAAIDRGALSHTANFLLPDSWTTAGVTDFTAIAENLNGQNAVAYANSAVFYERDIPKIWVYPFNEGTQAAPLLPTQADMVEQERVLKRLLPTPAVAFVHRGWTETGHQSGPINFTDMKRMLSRIWNSLAAAAAISNNVSSLPDMLFGFKVGSDPKAVGTSDPIYSGGNGIVVVGQADGSDFNSTTMLHEVNHNLDRSSKGTWGRHVADPNDLESKAWGCGAEGPDLAWPYDGTDNVQEIGFDTTRPWTDGAGQHLTVVPDTRDDYMSYCWKKGTPIQWISPYRWQALFGRFPGTAFAAAAAEPVVEPVYYVAGQLNVDGTGSLDPVQLMPGIASTDVAPGDYSIEVLDGSDTTLSTLSFTASFTDVEGVDLDTVYFSFQLAEQAGATKIVLKHNGEVLYSIVRSLNAPTAEVTAPVNADTWVDEATIQWTADDLDGDPLVFSLFYSPNQGVDWYPVASHLTGLEHTVAVDTLPGGDGGRIRLVASDGFNTTVVESDGAFSVPDPAPTVIINTPFDGQAFAPGEWIDLNGTASDPSGTPPEAFTYVWSLDGEPAEIGSEVTLSLEEGPHTIMLDAYDGEGNHGAASVIVNSTLNSPPNQPGDPTPADSATDVPVSIQLSWSGGDPDDDPVTYDVYLEPDSDTPVTFVCENISATTCVPPGDLLPSTTYYWQVVARDDQDALRESPVWRFDTEAGLADGVIFEDSFE